MSAQPAAPGKLQPLPVQRGGLGPFPPWLVATAIASTGVWAVEQYDRRLGWFLAIIVLIGVFIARDGGSSLARLMKAVFGTGG